MRERPTKADVAYFTGMFVLCDGEKHAITKEEATAIRSYLWENDYIDDKDQITEQYKSDLENNTLAPMSRKLAPMAEGIQMLIRALYDEATQDAVSKMFENGNKPNVQNNRLNENFNKKEFQALWNEINHKYAYTVHYNSEELIKNAIKSINANLHVNQLRYVVVSGEQQTVDAFDETSSASKTLNTLSTSSVAYDLVGEIARGATLTRRSVVKILNGLTPSKLAMFRNNPEEFIRNTIKLIREEKATMIIEHISYNLIEGKYDSSIFTREKPIQSLDKAYPAKKHILDYVFSDSVKERDFAKDMDAAAEVCVYAKLPRSFQIPTPVGNYAPDWAIAFDTGKVRHVFFIAETKGSMRSMDLRGVETAKIECAKRLFNEASTSNVRYDVVKSYDDMMNIIQSIN